MTLQRPLPVIIIFSADLIVSFKKELRRYRFFAAVPAAISPEAPAPTTITFLFIFGNILCFFVYLVFVPNTLELIELLITLHAYSALQQQ